MEMEHLISLHHNNLHSHMKGSPLVPYNASEEVLRYLGRGRVSSLREREAAIVDTHLQLEL